VFTTTEIDRGKSISYFSIFDHKYRNKTVESLLCEQ
jgi:hypothetical protein